MSDRTMPMQGKLPDLLRMQAARDSKAVRENLMSQAADALEYAERCVDRAAAQRDSAESKLATLTARCAELEGALRGVLSELERIGNAPATDQCQQHWDVDTETTITVARAALAKVTPC